MKELGTPSQRMKEKERLFFFVGTRTLTRSATQSKKGYKSRMTAFHSTAEKIGELWPDL